MSENNDDTGHETAGLMNYLPPEILENILIYLPAKDLLRCRAVSPIWRDVIDHICKNQQVWHAACKNDFQNVYTIARNKSKRGVQWYNLYRSLNLWRQLPDASEVRDEFASATRSAQEIRNFEILKDGILGVLKKGSIVYYDIETLAVSHHEPIIGDYSKYTENDNVIILLSYNLHLFIIRKLMREDGNVTFDNVKLFVVVGHDLYFVNVNDEIFVCDLRIKELTASFLSKSDDGVMSIGFSDGHLNILTFQRRIFTVVKEDLVLKYALTSESNVLHQLNYYNFLEQLDWRIYFQWMYLMNHPIPDGPLRDIVIIRPYGDVFFVGSNWGVLRIYYAPYEDGEIDLFCRDPIKQFNFMERSDCPVLSMCPILQVDVMEGNDAHTVIVAMPKKLVVLEFTHNFETEPCIFEEIPPDSPDTSSPDITFVSN
uniref:F-box domain-containing protein n=1 Tax=Heliothis virescens TaxID=7102 RepID=A0A2A4JCU3_HELVI